MGVINGLSYGVHGVNSTKNKVKKTQFVNEESLNDSPLIVSSKGIRLCDFSSQTFQRIQYDTPSYQDRKALEKYQSIMMYEKREAITAIFYVDFYV